MQMRFSGSTPNEIRTEVVNFLRVLAKREHENINQARTQKEQRASEHAELVLLQAAHTIERAVLPVEQD